jgi:MoCo/4Fe-4S cofactor protein with predicted Tat translocation signal
MKSRNMKKYWKSLEEYNGQPEEKGHDDINNLTALELLSGEISENKASRRDFLKWCGFSFMSAAVLASCESPVKKAIPFLNQPEELTPGMASWYASNFFDGKDFCPVVVKVRDGRPIMLEGNDLNHLTGKGMHARVQASVLSLYDTAGRYHQPFHNGDAMSWEKTDAEVLEKLKATDKEILLLTSTVISPSTIEAINKFKLRFPNARHVMYDAVSYSAMRQANMLSFGNNEIPFYRFDKAQLIIGFNADFLANWLMPVAFARQYSETRRIGKDKKTMSLHLQFESGMSVTGANADERFSIKPHEELQILQSVYRSLNGEGGSAHLHTGKLVELIRKNENETLLVSGSNDPKIQTLVNAINSLAGSYGNTIDFTHSLNLCQGSDADLIDAVKRMESGNVGALIACNVNPVYDYPGDDFKKALAKVDLKVSLTSALNETAEVSEYILPCPHYLESWDDVAPARGYFGITQPVINPLFDTRQFQDTLLLWSESGIAYKDLIQENWKNKIFTLQRNQSNFTAFWQDCLKEGVFAPEVETAATSAFNPSALNTVGALTSVTPTGEWSLVAYECTALGDGRHANNPWLQELPDPLTKVCWDNFAAVSPTDAAAMDIKNGDFIKVNDALELPVVVQPGQAPGTISVALGYGRKRSGKVAEGVGVNVFGFTGFKDGYRVYSTSVDAPVKIRSKVQMALTQTHHSMEGRAIVRESVLPAWIEEPSSGNELHKYHEKHKVTLYPEVNYEAHHWALAVDLNRCTGCSTCVIACQAENNVPVVGRIEVLRRRIMHWMRIDRYYNGDADNPQVVFQPLMCQHCDNAPCENVCPVAATTHSDEGINQITYNRCVGTKYCMNNCPYKVRRFNWFEYARNKNFDYHMNDDIGRLVLNPDVTVRERGVVEKCSFCIQRIQEEKLRAKLENRQMRDGDVKPACMQACPSNALVFGDLNDPESEVSKLYKDERNYHLLEELHTLPTVGYLTKIRNKT